MNTAIAMAVFIFSHVVIARTGLKPALIARLGERIYLLAYSLLSLLLLAWVIAAVMTARRHGLWATPGWAYGFAHAVSAAGFMLIGIGVVAPNPLSVSFRKTPFEPERPGVIGWVRHPLLWGLTLWGLAHVPANGDWPSLVLFAGSAAFGATGVRAVERRRQRELGRRQWQQLSAGRGHLDRHAFLGAGLGLALWFCLLAVHPILFGADPLAVLLARHS